MARQLGSNDYKALRDGVGENAEAHEIIAACEARGVSPEATAVALLDSGCLLVTEEQDRAHFAASATLQREFGGNATAYVAYRRASREGRVRFSGRGRDALLAPTDGDSDGGGNEASWTAEYNSSAELQHDFEPVGGLATFLAGKRADARRRRR